MHERHHREDWNGKTETSTAEQHLEDCAITTILKLNILKTLIWPLMLYGCEG